MDWVQLLAAGAPLAAAASTTAPAPAHAHAQPLVGEDRRIPTRSSPPSVAPPVAQAATQPLSPPLAVTLIRVGIICVRARRATGVATYSPGLEHDARVYERAFAAVDPDAPDVRFETVPISPEWDRNGVASEATLQALQDNLDVIIGIEELGSADMVHAIQTIKATNEKSPIVVWVPNCEVLDDRSTGKKWTATLSALPSSFIDFVLAKMPRREDFVRCIRQVYDAYDAPLADEQIVHVPHTCFLQDEAPVVVNKKKYHQKRAILNPDAATAAAATAAAAAAATTSSASSSAAAAPSVTGRSPSFFDVSNRTTILHFAGSSPHKNTLENCRAGLELVKQLNADSDALGEAAVSSSPRFTFTVFLCSWPSKRGDGPLFAIGQEAYDAIRALQAANADCFKLIASGFMSYAQRAKLYAQTRLALCASRAEGFGHYVLEAAASGCLVVTTDGAPMSSLCTVPKTFALAKPTYEEQQCYGFAFAVPAEAIVSAALSLPLLESTGYTSAVIAACAQNECAARARFTEAMHRFKRQLAALVTARQRGANTHTHSHTPTAALSVLPSMPAPASAPPPPPPGTFLRGVFMASNMNPSSSSSSYSTGPQQASMLPSPSILRAHDMPPSAQATAFGHTNSFDNFASLFAQASAPTPQLLAGSRFPPGLPIPLAAVSPSAAAPANSSAPTFHSGMSSLAALEARLCATQPPPQPWPPAIAAPAPPPPAPIAAPVRRTQPAEFDHPWLPWPQ